MDFKVTGTREGVTALQMDIKVKGIDERVIREGLKKAYVARHVDPRQDDRGAARGPRPR